MTEQPTDWIKDAGWIDSLYRLGQEGSRREFDALLRRLLYEHGASLATVPAADAGLRAAVEGLADELWTMAAKAEQRMHPMDTRGAAIGTGEVQAWVRQLRSLLAGRGDV